MTGAGGSHVFDTGPLSHFAKAQWLGVLKPITSEVRCVVPDTVVAELRAGRAERPYLGSVLEASWLEVVTVSSPAELDPFAKFHERLVGCDGRNVGECGVLADDLLINDYRLPFQVGGFESWAREQGLE